MLIFQCVSFVDVSLENIAVVYKCSHFSFPSLYMILVNFFP